MPATNDVTLASLKLLGLIDIQKWTTVENFVKWFIANVGVEIPGTVTNVQVSNLQPSDSQRDNLWVRLSSTGAFVGFYVWGAGTWNVIYPLDRQIIRMAGNSTTDVPAGFVLANDSAANLTSDVMVYLVSTWHLHSSTLYYDVFDVVFVGF